MALLLVAVMMASTVAVAADTVPDMKKQNTKQKSSENVRATFPDEPTVGFAMKDKLLNEFDTIREPDEIDRPDRPLTEADDKVSQQVLFGKDYAGEQQKWWITGTDPVNSENLVLFASDTLLEPMTFNEEIWQKYKFPVDAKGKYKFGTWENSIVRKKLKEAQQNKDFFSQTEQRLMCSSTIKTLNRAELFRTEHPGMDVSAWDGLSLNWQDYTVFGPLESSASEIHYASHDELYYETEEILYAPYGEKEYAFPTVGSGYGTRASTGQGNIISGSFLEDNRQSNREKSGNGEEKMPFWLRSPGTDYSPVDASVAAGWHEAGRDSALLAGNFDQETGSAAGAGIVVAYDPETTEGQQDLYTNKEYAVQPAFQLDTSNLLFGSTAEAAENHKEEIADGGKLALNEAMTLRFAAEKDELGTVTLTESEPDKDGNQHQQIEVKNAPQGTHLVVQFTGYPYEDQGILNDAWAIPVTGDETVSMEDVRINGKSVQDVIDEYESYEEPGNPASGLGNAGFLAEYRIWLEKTEDQITKASLAEYRLSVEGNEHITVDCGNGSSGEQSFIQDLTPVSVYDPNDKENPYIVGEEWVWSEDTTPCEKIVCTAEDGYYFPETYLEDHKIPGRKYGIEITRQDAKTLVVEPDAFMDDIFYYYAPYAARTIVLPMPEKVSQNLTVSKTVDKKGENLPDEAFEFKLSLTDEDNKPLTKASIDVIGADGNKTSLPLTDGCASFELKDQQKITIEKLPSGTKYQIVEVQNANYLPQYTTSENDANHTKQLTDGNTAEGMIQSGKDVTVAYTNTYSPGSPVSFIKISEDTGKPLGEAEFNLYTCNNTDADHQHMEQADGEAEDCWVPVLDESGKAKVYKSDVDGKVDLGNLKYDEYMLAEIKSPDGYELPKAQWLLKVSQGGIVFETKGDDKGPQFSTDTEADGTVIYKLPNKKKLTELLPNTGGKGTHLIYLIGIGLMIIGCVAGLKRKPQ